MAIKDEKLVAKINSEEKVAITEAAEQLDIPVSQFVREAVREKIAALKEASAEKPEAAVAPV
jgi:uncharacterized protein (DUF1778 family)